MARYAPLWNQADTYTAQVDRQLIPLLAPQGGAIGATPSPIANSLQVSVPTGKCVVPLATASGLLQGSALCVWDAAETVGPFPTPPGSGSYQAHLITCQVRDASLDGGGNNDFIIGFVSSAVVAGFPTIPTAPTNAYPLFSFTTGNGATNLNGVSFGDQRLPLLNVPGTFYRCRASRNAAFTVGSGAGNWVQFDTPISDQYGMLLNFGYPGDISLPIAGIWLITGIVSASPSASGLAMNVGLYYRRSGNLNLIAQTQTHTSTTWGMSGTIGPTTFAAQAGDLIHVNASNSSASSAWSGQGGSTVTYICCDYLGP